MSRRGRDDSYEERGYYAQETSAPRRGAPVRSRELDEVDVSVRRGGVDRDRQPDFLRQDITREDQPLVLRKRQDSTREDQPLVLRKREVETFTRPLEHRSPSPPERERVRTRIVERERARERTPSPPPVERERVRTRIVERERSPAPEPERARFRYVERDRSEPPPVERIRTRIVERERERTPSPPPERIRTTTRIIERERERTPSPPPERIRTTTRIVERERERTPSPPPERSRIRIIERERERPRSPSLESSPSPPPEPPIIRAPPIHQEIITHHRHIDHGFDYQPAPTPPPPVRVREPPRREEAEIDIYHGKGETQVDIYKTKDREREPARKVEGRDFYDDDVLYERDRELLRVRDSDSNRRRSMSARREAVRYDETEADYYGRKVDDRAYIGEAYNGATKEWAIVDVPPGTERVKMDGVGGGSQEISWQKYNGVRRSKFIPEREREREYDFIEREEVIDRRVGRPAAPPRPREPDMWTEITKDLIVREAIEELGYDYEETEFFYYIMQYLRYGDVQELVELSEHIKKERQNRIREIAYERERLKEAEERERREWERSRRVLPEYEDERIIEREIIYDPYRPRGYLR